MRNPFRRCKADRWPAPLVHTWERYDPKTGLAVPVGDQRGPESEYTVRRADVGKTLRVRVTAD